MSYINVRGVQHYYEWVKEPSESLGCRKPVMVFVHGWAGSARYWESTARVLSPSFDCLLYDMRGFGRSQTNSNSIAECGEDTINFSYDLKEYTRDLSILVRNLGIERFYISAHSMGASIATLFLNRYVEQVKGAILTCSGIFKYDEKTFTAFHRFGSYVVKFRPKWLEKIPLVDRIFMARFLHRSIPIKERKDFLKDFLCADYNAALGTIFTSVSEEQSKLMPQEFARLKVPTLLVSGEFDQIIPAIMGEHAASLSQAIEFAIVPKTGHFPMLEDAVTYCKIVQDFLSRNA
ncbi:Possible alpha/beta hydrolase superfamily,slr1916 homolog [Richelia intracellularis HH01]|uniref:Possible alpha/beta hydrolase superfamily,slr1916 homolog n=1 Tax=Richelia intracellularis HH01 TaxID=1165094 RepID=M1X6S6_9NOST|nr:alpha/beta hydrolase [Richelia intracellularis]CCH68411.1 Possible alpha/beta hydrolase superfamily,slr1916 homolog [Richelia intracellularis HH01]